MSEEIRWTKTNVEPTRGPHPDYPKNLTFAKKFCEDHPPTKLPKGMLVKLSGSPVLPESMVTISWKPPKEVHGGFFATPIFLHDSHREVTTKIDGVFKSYVRKCDEIEAKNPKQPTLFEPGLTNMDQKV